MGELVSLYSIQCSKLGQTPHSDIMSLLTGVQEAYNDNNTLLFDLSYKHLYSADVIPFVLSLSSVTQKKIYLDLSYNILDDNAYKVMVDVLQQTSCLRSLNLSGNYVGDESARSYISQMISSSSPSHDTTQNGLTKLLLRDCRIKSEGARAICDALQRNTSLSERKMGKTMKTPRGFEESNGGSPTNLKKFAPDRYIDSTLKSLALSYELERIKFQHRQEIEEMQKRYKKKLKDTTVNLNAKINSHYKAKEDIITMYAEFSDGIRNFKNVKNELEAAHSEVVKVQDRLKNQTDIEKENLEKVVNRHKQELEDVHRQHSLQVNEMKENLSKMRGEHEIVLENMKKTYEENVRSIQVRHEDETRLLVQEKEDMAKRFEENLRDVQKKQEEEVNRIISEGEETVAKYEHESDTRNREHEQERGNFAKDFQELKETYEQQLYRQASSLTEKFGKEVTELTSQNEAALEELKLYHSEQIDNMEKLISTKEKEIENLKIAHAREMEEKGEEIRTNSRESEEEVQKLKQAYDKDSGSMKQRHRQEVEEMEERYEMYIRKLKEEKINVVEELTLTHDEEIGEKDLIIEKLKADISRKLEQGMAKLNIDKEEEIAGLKALHQQEIEILKSELEIGREENEILKLSTAGQVEEFTIDFIQKLNNLKEEKDQEIAELHQKLHTLKEEKEEEVAAIRQQVSEEMEVFNAQRQEQVKQIKDDTLKELVMATQTHLEEVNTLNKNHFEDLEKLKSFYEEKNSQLTSSYEEKLQKKKLKKLTSTTKSLSTSPTTVAATKGITTSPNKKEVGSVVKTRSPSFSAKSPTKK